MSSKPVRFYAVINPQKQMLPLVYKSVLVGLIGGITVSLFRLTLARAESISFAAYAHVRENPVLVLLLFPLLILCGFFLRELVAHNKAIGGSGIPQVKGVILGYLKVNWLRTLIAKFVGTTVSMLAGLSLGREGPSVQLGASAAEGIGKKLASSHTEERILIASGASAGLAAAFNAPLAGAIFALEEIFKYISPNILLSTMLSAITADFVSRVLCGGEPVFDFAVSGSFPLAGYWLLCVLGAVLGALGALYNLTLLKSQAFLKKVTLGQGRIRLILPFLAAGILGFVFPVVLGGGHAAMAELRFTTGIVTMLGIFLLKFVFSMLSFGSGAPGGIFFPLLVLGASAGAVFGKLSISFLGLSPEVFDSFIVFAMAGYFTAIVRAPVTGIILLLEMTGSFANILPFALVSSISYVVAELLKSRPIYDSLLDRQLEDAGVSSSVAASDTKITVEAVVQHGAGVENQPVRAIPLPERCLLLSVRRSGQSLIPKGNTVIRANDTLVFLLNTDDEREYRPQLAALTSCLNP